MDGNELNGVRILEEKHMVSIMLALLDNDGCSKTDLYGMVSSNPRMPDKLGRLESAGLLTQVSEKDSRSVRLCLTDLGRAVASRLSDMESLMSGYE